MTGPPREECHRRRRLAHYTIHSSGRLRARIRDALIIVGARGIRMGNIDNYDAIMVHLGAHEKVHMRWGAIHDG